MDYTDYLAGKTKSEMDILDRLVGRFEDIQPSELTVEMGGGEVPQDEWPELDKWKMPNTLFDLLLGKAEISIVETSSSGPRTWVISDVDGLKKRFQLTSRGWMDGPARWIQADNFIEDGKLITSRKVFVTTRPQGGPRWTEVDQGLVMDCQDSFSLDKKGNLVREFSCSLPIPDIKMTIVMRARRVRVVRSKRRSLRHCVLL